MKITITWGCWQTTDCWNHVRPVSEGFSGAKIASLCDSDPWDSDSLQILRKNKIRNPSAENTSRPPKPILFPQSGRDIVEYMYSTVDY